APPPVREADNPRARRREADIPRGRRGVFPDVDGAVKAARAAHEQNEAAPLEARKRWVEVMRDAARKLVPALAKYAVEETGYGRIDDKLKKNTLCVDKTPGTEALQPIAWSGDDGLTLTERASYGVIGSITPTTNPTETIINNGIGMVAGGNAVGVNAPPYAARTSAFMIDKFNDAIVSAGGPENLLACVERPTIESAEALMKFPGVRRLGVP